MIGQTVTIVSEEENLKYVDVKIAQEVTRLSSCFSDWCSPTFIAVTP